VDQLVRSSAVDVIVVDSVAALVPRAELENGMSDQTIGLQARLMSKALRKITGSLSLSQCTIIFLNQLRSKVGVIYGSPEVTSGGNALKFYSSVRLDTRRKEILTDNTGIRCKVKVVKNKVAAPFKEVFLDILFGSGIDRMVRTQLCFLWLSLSQLFPAYGYIFLTLFFVLHSYPCMLTLRYVTQGCTVDAATDLDIIERRGSWYAYKGKNLAQGRLNVVEMLKQDSDLAAQLETEVRLALAELGSPASSSTTTIETDDDEVELGTGAEDLVETAPEEVSSSFDSELSLE